MDASAESCVYFVTLAGESIRVTCPSLLRTMCVGFSVVGVPAGSPSECTTESACPVSSKYVVVYLAAVPPLYGGSLTTVRVFQSVSYVSVVLLKLPLSW